MTGDGKGIKRPVQLEFTIVTPSGRDPNGLGCSPKQHMV